MPNKREDPIDQDLIGLLYRINRDEGSFRAMAAKAGVAPDVYARVARRASGMDGDSANRLAAAYGPRYGFTAHQVFDWLGLPQPGVSLSGASVSATGDPDDATLLANAELGRLMVDAQREFETPEDYELFRQTAVDVVRALYETSKRRRKRKMP